MVARVNTIVFRGIEGVPVEVQVMIAPGKVMMQNICSPEMMDFDGYQILLTPTQSRYGAVLGPKVAFGDPRAL